MSLHIGTGNQKNEWSYFNDAFTKLKNIYMKTEFKKITLLY